ncbi:MAG: hypothetical protein ACREMQ_12600, partial [Longimicrobiales bacterium]
MITDRHWAAVRDATTILLASVLLIGCEKEVTNPLESRTEEFERRRLFLAAPSEIFGEILVNGNRPTNITPYSIRFVPKAGFGRYYKGSSGNKVITEASASIGSTVQCPIPGGAGCGTFGAFDGYDTTELQTPKLWNGVWTAELIIRTTTTDTCRVDFAFNHVDGKSGNGSFLDTHAGDQKIKFNVSSSGNCLAGTGVEGDPFLHPRATSLLQALFQPGTPATFSGFTGDSFSLPARAQGGRGSYKYAWKTFSTADTVTFGAFTVNFSGVEFITQATKTVAFSQPGTYFLQYLLRDGNDVDGQGGNYAFSGVCRFEIATRPALGAKAVSNTLPGVATQYSWYATSATLKNVGTQTWTGTAFGLFQMPGQYWSPTSVAYGTGSTATHQTKTYYFNVGMMSSHTGWQNNYWKMKKSGVYFGDSIGTRTFVKASSEPPPVLP